MGVINVQNKYERNKQYVVLMLKTKVIKVMMQFVMIRHVFVVPSSARQHHAVEDISIRHSLLCGCISFAQSSVLSVMHNSVLPPGCF